jgi:ubiquinone/menaquinone biosynthesis C-methylase UbiE
MQVELDCALRVAEGRVLDVGAGTGRFSSALVGAGRRVTAIDLSAEMLGIASRNERAPDCVRASAFALPFMDEQFDSVVSFWLLLHFHNWSEILAEMIRVAKPGAAVIFEMQNALNFNEALRLTGDARFLPKNPSDFQAFTTDEDIAALSRRLNATVVWSRFYDLLNDNFIAKATLGQRYDRWVEEIRSTLQDEDCRRFWIRFEEEISLPAPLARKQLFIIRKGIFDREKYVHARTDCSPVSFNGAIVRLQRLFLEAFTPVYPELSNVFQIECANNR